MTSISGRELPRPLCAEVTNTGRPLRNLVVLLKNRKMFLARKSCIGLWQPTERYPELLKLIFQRLSNSKPNTEYPFRFRLLDGSLHILFPTCLQYLFVQCATELRPMGPIKSYDACVD